MEPEKKSSNGIWALVIIILIAAGIFLIMGNKTEEEYTPENFESDPETAEVQTEATATFSEDDDVTSLEADLNASIQELAQ